VRLAHQEGFSPGSEQTPAEGQDARSGHAMFFQPPQQGRLPLFRGKDGPTQHPVTKPIPDRDTIMPTDQQDGLGFRSQE
jgi:hypothetical protein